MINKIKFYIPVAVKQPVRNCIKYIKYHLRFLSIVSAVKNDKEMKIIVGAAETYQKNWYSTNEQWLDITNPLDWKNVFKSKKILTNVIAEHVFEHLSYESADTAIKCISNHLLPGGKLRIAVPDGYHPDQDYLKHIGINGIGADAHDHKQLLNADSLSSLLTKNGFSTVLIEGYDVNGKLIQVPWDSNDGFVLRSRQNKPSKKWGFPDAETSLIVDGVIS